MARVSSASIAALADSTEVKAATRDKAERILSFARSLAPVDTGRYLRSLHIVEGDGGTFTVVAGVPYAVYVEAEHGVLARALYLAGG